MSDLQEALLVVSPVHKPPERRVSLADLEAVELDPREKDNSLVNQFLVDLPEFVELEPDPWLPFRNAPSEDVFLKSCSSEVLAYIPMDTLYELTAHLITQQNKASNLKTTKRILQERKKQRNRFSAKRSKENARLANDAVRYALKSVLADVERNPNIWSLFSPQTREAIARAPFLSNKSC